MAESLSQYLQKHTAISGQLTKNQSLRLMVSDLTDQIEKSARTILNQKIQLEQITG
jgi:hypothetical protein